MTHNCCGKSCSCDCAANRENKMCTLTKSQKKSDVDKVAGLTKDPRYICLCCGRLADNKENLCDPTSLTSDK